MATIVNASAALRVRNEQNRPVCSISGVDSDMTEENAAGFVLGIQTMYNRGKIFARIHSVSDIEITA